MTADCVCLACGKVFNRARIKPDDGDMLICIDCGHVMTVGPELALREPTDEEKRDIAGDEEIIALMNAIAAVKEKFNDPSL